MRDFFYKNSQILTEASTGGVCEKLVLKNFEISQKNPSVGNFIKKRLHHMCFPVKFAKF